MSQINETTIKTPGVYINEIPSFPPSVAQVATAIPAFIGYTQTATKKGRDVTNQAVRISSLVQYKQYFGEGFPGLVAAVVLRNDNSVDSVAIEPRYQLYNAVRMFYANGGGDCYIISVGPYKDNGTAAILDFIDDGEERCLEVLRREDEPTLIVIPDAVLLGNADFNTLMQRSLNLCGEMQDRFTIMDVLNGDEDRSFDNTDVITVFRNGMGTSNLNYGAAYYPWLRSSLPYEFSYGNINLEKPAGTPIAVADVVVNNPSVTQIDRAIDDLDLVNDFINTPGFAVPFNVAPLDGPITTAFGFIANDASEVANKITYVKNILTAFLAFDGSFTDEDAANVIEGLTTQDIFTNYTQTGTPTSFSATDRLVRELLLLDMSYPVAPGPPLGIAVAGDFPDHNTTGLVADATIYDPAPADALAAAANIRNRLQQLYDNVVNYVLSFRSEVERRITSLDLQIIASSGVYANITNAIRSQGVVVVPSGAIAGVYASVDATRGVWKAPANVSLVNVIEPMVTISDRMQEDLNVDTNAGKSVNAIRSFIGKGVLVWGSRTLDAFSNDWRYIPVRRFYIMVEESVKKASMLFVFEPNDANTWVKIRAMIENYLTVLWRQGALAGPKPEQAFYVKVGLGQTMTFQDILEGRLIVEIGMAPVRPAEFIILRFSQIQQQA